MATSNQTGFLARFAIDSRAARAWAWYDWANSAMYTVVVTAIYPLFLANVLARDLPEGMATELLALTNGVSLAAVAFGALFLGAYADARGWRKRLLTVFATLGILATASMFFLGPGDYVLGLTAYGIANFGVAMSVVFYDALLPHVAPEGREDDLSSTGFAFGYIGGGLLLALAVGVIFYATKLGLPAVEEDDTQLVFRISFVLVALWWAVFMTPLLRNVPEPPSEGRTMGVGDVLGQVVGIWRSLMGFPQAALLLLAFLLYSDGINTMVRMSSIYADELGIGSGTIITVFLAIQFVAMPATLLFAGLARKVGAKAVVLLGVAAFIVITVFAYGMSTETDFWILGLSVGAVMGAVQALSRSLFARMIPAAKSGEFFGVFALGEKVGGALGPFLFFTAMKAFDSSRSAILVLVVIFLAGGAVLLRVNVQKGEEAVRRFESGTP